MVGDFWRFFRYFGAVTDSGVEQRHRRRLLQPTHRDWNHRGQRHARVSVHERFAKKIFWDLRNLQDSRFKPHDSPARRLPHGICSASRVASLLPPSQLGSCLALVKSWRFQSESPMVHSVAALSALWWPRHWFRARRALIKAFWNVCALLCERGWK